MLPQSPVRRQIGSLQRFFLIVSGPLWLPVYWLIQLVLGLVGLANYIVLDRTLLSILPRALAGRVNKIKRSTIWPISLLLMPLAIICQMILALVGLFLWWHQLLGRWQGGLKGRFWSFFVGLIWQGVFLLILIGSYYHPLAWRVLGKELPLSLWYYLPTEPVSRQLLVGPLAWMAVVLLLLPILMAPLRRPRLCGLVFPLRIALALGGFYSVILINHSVLDRIWLYASFAIVAGIVLVAMMLLAGKTLRRGSGLRQFVWFTSTRLLEKKRIALFSLAAVTLCTAMLLIIVSIMGGFVQKVRAATHGLMGDVILEGDPVRGFPYYQEFIDVLKEPPYNEFIQQATPVIYSYGLFRVPKPYDSQASWTRSVRVVGINLEEKITVTDFGSSLNIYNQDPKQVILDSPIEVTGQTEKLYGLIYGLDLLARRNTDSSYSRYVTPLSTATLSVLPVTIKGTFLTTTAVTKKFYLVDDSRTGVYDTDSMHVYVGFEMLQEMLYMEQQTLDDNTTQPARAHQIQIKLQPGIDLYSQALPLIRGVWWAFMINSDDPLVADVRAESWEQYNATFIGAVENERHLMIIIFGIVSTVAIFLILCIFYMIVVEKTRDIGIFKSVGGSAGQIAAIFLAYAAVIGTIGAALGTLLGWTFVRRINEIETWLENVFGWQVWNREVYAFDEIPNTVDPREAAVIVTAAILASIIGAIIPAIRAARMNPVEALRYE